MPSPKGSINDAVFHRQRSWIHKSRLPPAERLPRRHRSRRFGVCLAGMTLLTAIGCSVNRTNVFDDTRVRLPLPRVTDNSFTLDIFFARIPCDPLFDEQLWAEIDEQAIDPEVRRQLTTDGFRCGLVEAQTPKKLEQILDTGQPAPRDNPLPAPDDGGLAALGLPHGTSLTATADQNRRIYLRTGRHAEVVTSNVREKITILRRSGEVVSGTTYADAQTAFRLTAVDAGNGRTRVSLSPEVQHGPPRTRFTGREGSLSLAASRECDEFDELTIQAPMVAGQTLIVTSTNEPLTVGGNFFQCVDDPRRQRKLLLIRLVHAGQEKLFDDAENELTIDDL